MKNFHWGHAILIFFIGYIAILAFIMFKSTQVNHNLVVEDYYAQDIAYQKKYDKISNAIRDKKSMIVEWDKEGKYLEVIFEDKASKEGTILLYNPSDKFKDIMLPFISDSGDTLRFDNVVLTGGRWKIQSDWIENGVEYYLQEEMYVTYP